MSRPERKVRYGVAMSLDGFIAGPQGEYDWIANDPEADAALVEIWSRFDILLMGRRTYEVAKPMFTRENVGSKTVVVASRPLQPEHNPEITVVRDLDAPRIQALRRQGGRDTQNTQDVQKTQETQDTQDIWLMGGAALFGHVLRLGEVDGVDVSVMPVLLGAGVPLLPEIGKRVELKLTAHRVFASGIVSLHYDVMRGE